MFSLPSSLFRASLTRPALQALERALTSPHVTVDPPDEPDPTLLESVDDPFTSVADVADRLGQLEATLRDRCDRRSVFLTVYVLMTETTDAAIRDGEFEDERWIRQYLVQFADYYRRAFVAFERGKLHSVPRPWQLAFGTALRGDALVVQDAFLGINAHINYDLALTLTDVGVHPGTQHKYEDHCRVNTILGRLVDAQQTALTDIYAAGLADVDDALGRLDEQFSLFTLAEGREQAWRVARVRSAGRWKPVDTYSRWLLHATATGGAHYILQPKLNPSLLRALRAIEAGQETAVVDRLRTEVATILRDTPDNGS